MTQGKEDLKAYEDKNTHSGVTLNRSFCGNCGSPLFLTTGLLEKAVSITCGTVDDNQDWLPTVELFCSRRCPWVPEFAGMQKSNLQEVGM